MKPDVPMPLVIVKAPQGVFEVGDVMCHGYQSTCCHLRRFALKRNGTTIRNRTLRSSTTRGA